MKEIFSVILAAGEGKRIHSRLPKVLHPICGRSMIKYILDSAVELTEKVVIVVGHGASHVQAALGDRWHYVLQEEQLGTGHAALKAIEVLPREGTLIVLCGDTPLLKAKYLKEMLHSFEQKAAAVVATTIVPDPSGYGRIVRDQDGLVEGIVEERDASRQEKEIDEINTGTYCFDLKLLKHYLPLLTAENVQKEYYLTDVIALMRGDGHVVGACRIDDYRVGLGINNRVQLAEVASILRKEINRNLMLAGVSIEDPDSTYIDYDVRVGADSVIRPNCVLDQGTVIGCSCHIGPNTHLSAVVAEDDAVI